MQHAMLREYPTGRCALSGVKEKLSMVLRLVDWL
jgi:hypothetical protein